MGKSSLGSKLEKFYMDSKMLLRLSTKPRWDEFWQLFKVIMLIIALLGIVGFTIRFLMQNFSSALGGA